MDLLKEEYRMLGRTHKLKTLVVTVAMVLATFIVMASSITRDEVTACAGVNQQVDVGESVHLDGGCSIGVGTLSYKWFFGDGDVGYGVEQDHVYDSIGPSGELARIRSSTRTIQSGSTIPAPGIRTTTSYPRTGITVTAPTRMSP
jgi:hypothetical protein